MRSEKSLCDNCDNRESDKFGFWCMAMCKVEDNKKRCKHHEPKYRQLNIEDIKRD